MVQLLATIVPGRTDLTTIPHALGPGRPLGLAVGPAAFPTPKTDATVDGIDPLRLGMRLASTTWYPIPVEDEPIRAWARLGTVMRQLMG